jgi:hypothetical protein
MCLAERRIETANTVIWSESTESVLSVCPVSNGDTIAALSKSVVITELVFLDNYPYFAVCGSVMLEKDDES